MSKFVIPPQIQEFAPEWGIVLGSGLGNVAGRVRSPFSVSFDETPGLPVSRVPGHSGRWVAGTLGGARVLIAQGRSHLYEGCGASAVTAGTRFMAQAGVRKLILTNAAGAVNPAFPPGTWMLLSDHINLTGTSPLVGGPDFVDMTAVYSAELRAFFSGVAERGGFALSQGVYAGVLGPQYETPAEVRMLRGFGADAVGMSTVLEAIQARALGLEVAGFACLANWGAGLVESTLSHEEVLRSVDVASESFGAYLEAALAELTLSALTQPGKGSVPVRAE